MAFVRVKFIKAHPDFAYFAGDTGMIDADKAAKMTNEGYVFPLPEPVIEAVKVNLLPEDLPGRDKLFSLGFENVEKVREAGDALLDAGFSKSMITKIRKYFEPVD